MENTWSRRKNDDSGFTLIELIIVIVVLGIISSVAFPKFVGLSDEARLSAARGVGGSVSSTIMNLHSNYLIRATDYDASDAITGTTLSGGITVTNSSDTLIFVSGSKTYNWTYNPRIGINSAFLEEDSSSDFP